MAEAFVSKDQFNEFVKRMEQGFHHADQRHNDLIAMIDKRHSDLIAMIDKRHSDLIAMIDQRFTQIDQRFTQTDQRFAQIDQRFTQIDQRVDRLERRMDQGFTEIRQDMRTLNTAVQRQMWALIAVVVGAAIKVLFFP